MAGGGALVSWFAADLDVQLDATIARAEKAEAEVVRLQRANAALREHARELSAIAAKADGYALAAEVAAREVARFKRRAEKAEAQYAAAVDAEFACVCFPDGPCLGVPGESDACDACLRLDPEAACLREGAPGDDDV